LKLKKNNFLFLIFPHSMINLKKNIVRRASKSKKLIKTYLLKNLRKILINFAKQKSRIIIKRFIKYSGGLLSI
jgi:hypothetical protein